MHVPLFCGVMIITMMVEELMQMVTLCFVCFDSTQETDRFGCCCEISSLYDKELDIYPNPQLASVGDETTLVCNSVRKLDKSIVRNDIANNREFVAHLDSLERFKLNQLLFL